MKYPRRHTRITYEGLSFMSVLAFIILGAIIRQVNLLMLLSGLMIAPFFFNWRISMKMLERVIGVRRLPRMIFAGSPFTVGWRLKNSRTRIPSWGLRVVDRIGRVDAKYLDRVTVLVPPIAPAAETDVGYQCLLVKRGIYQLGPAQISSAFPVGLIRSKIKLQNVETFYVAPAIGRLHRSWDQMTQSLSRGEAKKQRQQRSETGDFYALRPWVTGDNPRQVHWRSSARHGDLMVRQNEQQQDRRLVLILDLAETSQAEGDIEMTLSLMATIFKKYSVGRGQPAVGVCGDQQWVCEHLNGTALAALMEVLATIQPAESNGFHDAWESLVPASARARSVIVISTRSQEQAFAEADLPTFRGKWIDVTREDLTRYFQPPSIKPGEFLNQIAKQLENDA
ncbi:MAG: DUF58 domain-containing protein [Pirellulaceae bacterium]|nr:DUF58 domain-containing protein [Pirellulaceae bacterium]